MFNIAIVDNNILFLNDMEDKVRKAMYLKYLPFYIRSYENAESFISDLSEENTYDLLFIDIRLDKNRNGIEEAKQIIKLSPGIQIVFVTYYPQYYLDVYEVPHIYLVTKDKLDLLLPKAIDTALKNYMYSGNDTLTVRIKYETVVIHKRDILFLEKNLRQITAYTSDKTLTFYSNSSDILEKLGARFVRCHKSYIINIDHIVKVEGHFVIVTDGTKIPVSRTYSKPLFDVLSGKNSERGSE